LSEGTWLSVNPRGQAIKTQTKRQRNREGKEAKKLMSEALKKTQRKCPENVLKISCSERMALAKSEAIILLAQGLSIDATARRVGVHERTIDNWLKKPEFQEQVSRATFHFGLALAANRMRLLNKVAEKMAEEEILDKLAENATVNDLLNILKHAGELEKQQPTMTIEQFEKLLIDAGWTPPPGVECQPMVDTIEAEAEEVEKENYQNG
jgi:transposase